MPYKRFLAQIRRIGELAAVRTSPVVGRDGLYDTTTDLSPSNAAAGPYLYNVTPDYFRASGTLYWRAEPSNGMTTQTARGVAVVNPESQARYWLHTGRYGR